MDDWEVFFYDEERAVVSSLSKYHAEECGIEPLVEAHPDVIYFFAKLEMHRDWDFNQYAGFRRLCDPPLPGLEFYEVSLDAEPNAFGHSIELVCNGEKNCYADRHANDCPKWEE